MEKNFEDLMRQKSDEALSDYIENASKYTAQAIQAAVNELRNRGRQFTEAELQEINRKFQEKADLKKKEEKSLSKNSWKKNIVTDPSAPLYYSQRAILGFSVVFTVVFGAALLASNATQNKAKWMIWCFGSGYTIIAILIVNQVGTNTRLTLAINSIGALLLTQVFWNKYIGEDTQFRAKPIWKPLIISILITIPFFLATIYY